MHKNKYDVIIDMRSTIRTLFFSLFIKNPFPDRAHQRIYTFSTELPDRHLQ